MVSKREWKKLPDDASGLLLSPLLVLSCSEPTKSRHRPKAEKLSKKNEIHEKLAELHHRLGMSRICLMKFWARCSRLNRTNRELDTRLRDVPQKFHLHFDFHSRIRISVFFVLITCCPLNSTGVDCVGLWAVECVGSRLELVRQTTEDTIDRDGHRQLRGISRDFRPTPRISC